MNARVDNFSYKPLPPTGNPNIAGANTAINNIVEFMQENGIHFDPRSIIIGHQGKGLLDQLRTSFRSDAFKDLPPEKLEELKELLEDLNVGLQNSGFFQPQNFKPGGQLDKDFNSWHGILDQLIKEKPAQPPTTPPTTQTSTTPPTTQPSTSSSFTDQPWYKGLEEIAKSSSEPNPVIVAILEKLKNAPPDIFSGQRPLPANPEHNLPEMTPGMPWNQKLNELHNEMKVALSEYENNLADSAAKKKFEDASKNFFDTLARLAQLVNPGQ
jgi:hypothetical protein